METLINWGYLGLFVATFLAGSILPFSSEVVLSSLLIAGGNAWYCLLAASVGNFLGGMTCYWLGRLGNIQWLEKYLHVKEEKLNKAVGFLQGKGSFFAFFTFLPFVGDLLAVGLGYLRANPWITAISMLIGKSVRYLVWIQLTFSVKNGLF